MLRIALVDGCYGAGGAALCNNVACAAFATSALRSHTQFQLDFIKAQTGTHLACDFTVRDTVADTDDHGGTCEMFKDECIINANPSHLQC